MLKTQQQQLESLAKERHILEDRIKMQYHINGGFLMFVSMKMSSLRDGACAGFCKKAHMMVGLKQREAYFCKMKLVEKEDELTDFRIWFDILSKNSKDISQRDPKETRKGIMSGRKYSSSKFATFEDTGRQCKKAEARRETSAPRVPDLMKDNEKGRRSSKRKRDDVGFLKRQNCSLLHLKFPD
ncbi:hypothetical protein PTKIN_Ptkin13bG0012600 [Pterospermum kingtungense]